MLLARNNAHARALFVSPTRGGIAQWRSAASIYKLPTTKLPTKRKKRNPVTISSSILSASNDVAEKLLATGLIRRWAAEDSANPAITRTTDRSRVNLVSENLCDDIFKYYGDALRERHQGCDIVDLFPGVGVWSRKLNDLLQPRSHLLLEPDADFYKPFLEPLLERPGVRVLAKSGVEWEHLPDILTPENFPHQVEQSESYPPQRNDTLLLTANFSWNPQRNFQGLGSLPRLLMYQFIKSVQRASMFQRYGLVRMLLWVPDYEKLSIVPRSVQLRRRLAAEADLSAEWVVEVAGSEGPTYHRDMRDENIDIESAQRTIDRMRDRGIVIPKGRESSTYLSTLDRQDKVVAGQQPPVYVFSAEEELRELNATVTKDSTSAEKRKRASKKSYVKSKLATYATIHETLQEKEGLVREYKAAKDDPEKLAAWKQRAALYEEKITALSLAYRKAWKPAHDNLMAIRQEPPLLQWDRRPLEPLQVKPDEFLPNVPCALLDIQPKVPNQNIWRRGIEPKHRIPDIIDLLSLHVFSTYATSPVVQVLNKMHPGANEDLIPGSPSLKDPDAGGSPLEGEWGSLDGRCMNEKQMNEIIAAWAESPFTPDFFSLVGTTYYTGESADTGSTPGLATGKMSSKNLR